MWSLVARIRRSRRESSGGMTLIEILVVVAILGLIMGISIPTLSGFTAANLRSSSSAVSSAVRYMFDMASMTGSYCRLAFELQGSEYSAECADKPFYLSRRLEEADQHGEREAAEDNGPKVNEGDEDQQSELKRVKANFREVKTRLLKKGKIADGIRFDGIMTSHQKDRFTKGTGYLYFFPGGYTERAYIYLADESGGVYTVLVSPLTGRVEVKAESVEPER